MRTIPLPQPPRAGQSATPIPPTSIVSVPRASQTGCAVCLVPSSPPLNLSVVPFNLTSMRRLYPVCLSCFWGEGGGPCKIVTAGRGKSWRAAVQLPCNPFLQISRLLEVPGVSPLHGQGSPGQQAAGSPVSRPAWCRQQGWWRSLDKQLPSLGGP